MLGRTTAETHSGNTGYTNRVYDKASRVTSQQNLTLGKETYGYDNLDRLTNYTSKANGKTINQSYTYDPAGNRTKSIINGVTSNYTYDKANELTTDGTNTYSYDANGNQTQIKAGNNVLSTSIYDGENQAIKSTTPTSETNTVYDFLQRPVVVYSTPVTQTPAPRPAPGQLSAQPSTLNLTYTQFTSDRLTQSKSLISPLPQVLKSGEYTGVMLNNPNTRQLLSAAVITPDWNTLDTANKTRWTFNLHTDQQNTTHSVTQVNNSNVILSQAFDPFGSTLTSNLNLGSLNNPLIKTKEDLLNLSIPIPGWQGSTQESTSVTNFGRRQYNSSTASFSSLDPSHYLLGMRYQFMLKQ